MSVLNRRLFNRGGRVMSSRGVGITSGLVNQPVQKFVKGGEASNRVDKYNTILDELRSMDVVQERQPFNKFQNAAPAALDFFGGLMSGTSTQGGLSGGLEIAGESLKSSSPLFAQALKNKQEYDATDPEAAIKNLALGEAFKKDDPRYEYKVSDGNIIKIDLLGKEEPVVTPLPSSDSQELQNAPTNVYGDFSNNSGEILENTLAQQFTMKNGETVYKIGGVDYSNYTPKDQPKDVEAPIIYTKNFKDQDNVLQQQEYISINNGEFQLHGDPTPLYEPKDEPKWKLSTTKDQKIIKGGKSYTKHFAVYNKEGFTEPKLVEMFESENTDEKKRASSGNIVFKDGNKIGESYAAIEFNDGSVSYFAGVGEPNADENGLVKATDAFDFFSSNITADSKRDLFGEKDKEKASMQIAEAAQLLAAGSQLLNQVNELGTNVNTLNRSILDQGGKFLSQLPGVGPGAKEALFELFDADPIALQKFITNSRIFVAQNISTITGEGSSRVSEPERFLANQALSLLEAMTDGTSATAAIKASMASTYIQSHRQQIVAGVLDIKLNETSLGGETFKLPTNGNIINSNVAKYHASLLKTNYGFTNKEVANLLTQMSIMEKSGLNRLSQITDSQSMYYKNNKDAIQKQFFVLSGKGN